MMPRLSVFTPIYLSIILPETQKLARPIDRKVAVVSFTKTLADSEAFSVRYQKGWGFTCEALLKLLEVPPVPVAADDAVIPDADVDDLSFGVGFTPLNTCKKPIRDPWPEITDVKAWVGQYLKEADGRHGGKVRETSIHVFIMLWTLTSLTKQISGFVQERLSPQVREVLLSYMK
jgi:exportin-2 (importin alpha re-exporter)